MKIISKAFPVIFFLFFCIRCFRNDRLVGMSSLEAASYMPHDFDSHSLKAHKALMPSTF